MTCPATDWSDNECALPLGHEGEHCTVLYWSDPEPYQPGPPTALSTMVETVYGPYVRQSLSASSLLSFISSRAVTGDVTFHFHHGEGENP